MFCIHIAMLEYHTTFAEIISQCSKQKHIIHQNTCMFTIDWFDVYSASWVHRGNDHIPPPPPPRRGGHCIYFLLGGV